LRDGLSNIRKRLRIDECPSDIVCRPAGMARRGSPLVPTRTSVTEAVVSGPPAFGILSGTGDILQRADGCYPDGAVSQPRLAPTSTTLPEPERHYPDPAPARLSRRKPGSIGHNLPAIARSAAPSQSAAPVAAPARASPPFSPRTAGRPSGRKTILQRARAAGIFQPGLSDSPIKIM